MNRIERARTADTDSRGIALVAVLVILGTLLAIATPFMISMRNHDRATSVSIDHAKTAQSLRATLAAAEATIARTDPALDPTPHVDALAEMKVDLAAEFVRFGVNANDPKDAIRSARIEDEQAKIDINACSPFLLGNLINPMRLIGDLEPEDEKTLTVSSTDGLPESGIVWIDGELILYGSKTQRELLDLKRGFTTSVLTSHGASAHENGRPVVDYRVILATVYPYKSTAESNTATAEYSGFVTPRGIKDIGRFGELGFTADEIDRFEREITTYSVVPAGDRFGVEARAVGVYTQRSHPSPLEVTGARDINAGTVVRLRAGKRVEYNLVVAATETGSNGRMALVFQEPVRFDYAADELLVAPLLRAPININTCSRRVLVALLSGLHRSGVKSALDADTVKLLADRIERARPIQGEPGFARLLSEMLADEALREIVTPDVAKTVLANAINALDTTLRTSTAPFCYRNLGTVTIEAAASQNLAAGREAGRMFAREVIATSPGGVRSTILDSQLEFAEAARLSRGSRFWTTFPVNVQDQDNGNDPPLPLVSYLDYGRVPVVSAEDQLKLEAAGRSPFARLRPVSKGGRRDGTATASDRVFHCDEPFIPKRTGEKLPQVDDPDGWDIAVRGPRSFSTVDPALDLVAQVNGFIQPFCFELWWKPGEAEGEQYIFDSGENELSNRIFAYFDGETLYFRVADTTIPDYETNSKDGPTTMAEIRYAFDDGLPFERDVWYHLSFFARGTKPTDMALFVDGVPRGRRAFVSRLSKSVGPVQANTGPFSGIKGYGQGKAEVLDVEDTRLFPEYGVLRIGDELVEYSSKNDKDGKFVLAPAGAEPFGGRGRRGTGEDPFQKVVKSGQQQAAKVIHPETQGVELYGYAAILMQRQVPTGDSTLSDQLGKLGVAMVNPSAKEAKQTIYPDDPDIPTQLNFNFGTGLLATETTIPITALGKPTTTSSSSGSSGSVADGMFDKNGGFALLVSSPVPPPSVTDYQEDFGNGAQQFTISLGWINPAVTKNGMLGKIELISYQEFDGNALKGCGRAGSGFNAKQFQPQSNLANAQGNVGIGGGGNGAGGGRTVAYETNMIVSKGHDHISKWNTIFVDQDHDATQPIYVIPVSVKAGKTFNAATNEWAIPEVGGGRNSNGSTRPEMVQIGVDFAGADSGTEWVRYDAIANGCFVRDNPDRVENAGMLLGHYLTARYTAKQGTIPDSELVARAVNFENIEVNAEDKQQIVEALTAGTQGSGSSVGVETLLNNGIGCLAFRGVLGTGMKSHGAGERILPVFRTVRGPTPDYGRPGRRDFITLVDPANHTREEHRINFGYCEPDVEGWGWAACHIGLDAGVDGTFVSNFFPSLYQIDPDDSDSGWKELANQMLESRDLTRVLKFPSGELPFQLGEDFHFGADLNGDPSPAGGKLDEIELFTPTTPDPGFLAHHYVLDYFDEKKGELWVNSWHLRDPARDKGGPAIEALDPMMRLPQDGIVLQVGEELIACKALRFEEESGGGHVSKFGVFEVAEAGRGWLGTPIQYHGRGEGIREMTFLRVTRVARDLGADDNLISLADTSDFDDRGVIHVGRELIGYTRKQGANQLFMPEWRDELGKSVGLLRGSYGTQRERQPADMLAYQFPVRHLDRYRPLADDPELGYLGLAFPEKRAFFKEMSWTATGESKLARLVVEARVAGRGSFTDPANANPDRFTFTTERASDLPKFEILRQGDVLELRVFTQYLPGAFDSQVFEPDPERERGGSNDWKRAPELRALGIEWISSPARLAYEEWR